MLLIVKLKHEYQFVLATSMPETYEHEHFDRGMVGDNWGDTLGVVWRVLVYIRLGEDLGFNLSSTYSSGGLLNRCRNK